MKGVLMTKMVQELNLTNLTPEIDLSEMRIMTAEINRPALQLTGSLCNKCRYIVFDCHIDHVL